MRGFGGIQRMRASGLRITEFAATGSDVPPDHKCGGSFSPAFSKIRATSAAADCMQFMGVYNFLGFRIPFVGTNADLQPFRFLNVFHAFQNKEVL